MAYIGTSPSNGVRRIHTYTATAGQTTFTGSSTEGVTLSYADTNYIDVFQNGVLLGSADYTSTSGTSVVLAQGASVSDLVVIVVYDVFSVADTVSKTAGGSFDSPLTITTADNNAQLTLKSTDADANVGPVLDLQRDSSSPADNDVLGIVNFKGENDASEVIDYGSINAYINDASDGTEDGRVIHRLYKGGTNINYVDMKPDEIVFNEDSKDHDFRIESDSMSHQLHMNGSNGKFTINANSAQSPSSHFTLFFASASYSAFAAEETDGGSGAGFFIMRKSGGSTIGQIKRNGTADEVQYVTTSDYRLKENVNYDFDATTTLKKLKPCEFNWISDEKNTTITGFLAHEVQEVYPHAASGEKDAMETYTDSDGKEQTRIEPQGIEKSDLVPLLVKTIQELEARITALESK